MLKRRSRLFLLLPCHHRPFSSPISFCSSLFLLHQFVICPPLTMAPSPSPQQKVPKMPESSLMVQQHNINNNNNNILNNNYYNNNNNNNVGGPLGYDDQLELLAHSSRMARTCRHDCSISDPNAEKCWNDTLLFYEQMLFGTLRRIILVETNRILWMMAQRDQHHQSGVNYEKLTNDSFHRLMQLPRGQSVADENDWEEGPLVFERISSAITDSVRQLTTKLHHFYSNGHGPMNEPPPFLRFDCPRPCERSYSAWKWLFVASLCLALLQLLLIALFIFLLDRREQKVWGTESADFGENASVVLVKGQKQ